MIKIIFCIVAFSFSAPVWAAKFEKQKITLGHVSNFEVELADSDEKREQGLMNRSSMSDKEGMLFIFPEERTLSFWMKSTLIPLSIGFINSDGKLFQILDMDPASPVELQPKVYVSAKPARFALEVPKGWFGRKKVKLGDKLQPTHF